MKMETIVWKTHIYKYGKVNNSIVDSRVLKLADFYR